MRAEFDREYQDSVRVDFDRHLQQFDEFLEKTLPGRLIPVVNFSSGQYAKALGLKGADMNWLLVDVRKLGIMDYLLSLSSHRSLIPSQVFDKDRLLAFGALAYFIVKRYPKTENGHLANIRDPRQTFPWKEIVTETKDYLLENPLTALLHFPTQEDSESSPSSDNRFSQDPDLLEVETRVDRARPPGVEDKFPHLDQPEQTALARVKLEEINQLLASLPVNSPESVNFLRHAPHYVVESVMFIAQAALGRLSAHQPDEPHQLYSFCNGLKICRKYLENSNIQNLGIQNLAQLVKAFETAIKKDPQKYWNSPRSVRI